VEECGLTFLHVFPYSKRPGTPAARMPQVAGEAIKERAKRLRATGEAALQKRLASESRRDASGVDREREAGGGRNTFCRWRFRRDAGRGAVAQNRGA